MRCPSCGFTIDPANESQSVCPACGTDPVAATEPTADPDARSMLAALKRQTSAFPARRFVVEGSKSIN